MVSKKIFLLSFLTWISLACNSSSQFQINQEEVEEIVNTLASDEMEGRKAFTTGIEKASDFIENEFKEIGLETLEGLDSYKQSFTIYHLSPDSADINLNGNNIDRGHYAISTNFQSLNFDGTEDLDIVTVRENDDFFSIFNETRNGNEDALVLVHPGHEGSFIRIRNFLNRGSHTFELNSGNTVIYILMEPVEVVNYRITLDNDVEEKKLNNVVGKVTGKRKDEIVLFSAHYDHIGIRNAVEGDSIANGANDNASGTTAVITLAEYFKNREQPERTLIFAAFTAEEIGGYGSRYFARQLDPDQIMAMFNIEMIGKPAVEGPNTAWITGWDKSDFGQILQDAVKDTKYEFYPDPYPDQNLFYRSDNATLARLGVPAHSISTTPIDVDRDYHQVTDEVHTLDLAHLTNTIKAIAAGAEPIIAGEVTPSRVDPADIN